MQTVCLFVCLFVCVVFWVWLFCTLDADLFAAPLLSETCRRAIWNAHMTYKRLRLMPYFYHAEYTNLVWFVYILLVILRQRMSGFGTPLLLVQYDIDRDQKKPVSTIFIRGNEITHKMCAYEQLHSKINYNGQFASCTLYLEGRHEKKNNKQDCKPLLYLVFLTIHIYNETPPLTFFKNVSHVSRYFRDVRVLSLSNY